MLYPMIGYTVNRNAITVDIWTSCVIWACGEATVAGTQVTKSNNSWHTPIYENR
jgi:hypothetical protein